MSPANPLQCILKQGSQLPTATSFNPKPRYMLLIWKMSWAANVHYESWMSMKECKEPQMIIYERKQLTFSIRIWTVGSFLFARGFVNLRGLPARLTGIEIHHISLFFGRALLWRHAAPWLRKIQMQTPGCQWCYLSGSLHFSLESHIFISCTVKKAIHVALKGCYSFNATREWKPSARLAWAAEKFLSRWGLKILTLL